MIKILNSMIFGFITGILFYKLILKDLDHKKFHHGPNSNDIKKYVYQKGDKYYKFKPVICPCPI